MLITSLFISFFGWTFFSREFPAFFQRFFLFLSLSFIPSSSWWVSPFLFHLWLCLCELVQCSTWLWRNDLFQLTNISSVCFFFSPLYLCRLIDVCTWFDHFNVKKLNQILHWTYCEVLEDNRIGTYTLESSHKMINNLATANQQFKRIIFSDKSK